MFDRILASKHRLTDKGNNYLSFMCLRFSLLSSFVAVKHVLLLNTFFFSVTKKSKALVHATFKSHFKTEMKLFLSSSRERERRIC